MTFQGKTYTSMIYMEEMIMTWEEVLNILKIQLINQLENREVLAAKETQVSINVYEKCIDEMKKQQEDFYTRVTALMTECNDLCGKIFVQKFIKGKSNPDIMEYLHISKTTLYDYLKKIKKMMENTTYGKQIEEFLTSE